MMPPLPLLPCATVVTIPPTRDSASAIVIIRVTESLYQNLRPVFIKAPPHGSAQPVRLLRRGDSIGLLPTILKTARELFVTGREPARVTSRATVVSKIAPTV